MSAFDGLEINITLEFQYQCIFKRLEPKKILC